MLSTDTVRRDGTRRTVWVTTAAAIIFLSAGCASQIPGHALTTTTAATATTATTVSPAADWNPQHRRTVAADIHQATATIHVGERLQFTARDSDTVNFEVEPSDLHSITFYGNDLTFVGIKAGTTTLSIPNYDKHFDCPNGPCAHPNAPLSMTVTVLAGSAAAPTIPAPVLVSTAGADRTVHLRVGQQLRIAPGLRMSTYSSDAAGVVLDGELGSIADRAASGVTLVGAGPGTQMIDLVPESAGSATLSTRLTIVIDS